MTNNRRKIERLRNARRRGLSFRAIESRLGKTLGLKAGNGTAAMRMLRSVGGL